MTEFETLIALNWTCGEENQAEEIAFRNERIRHRRTDIRRAILLITVPLALALIITFIIWVVEASYGIKITS